MLGFSSKKHQGNCRDRLSELPDEILIHILSFLPIEDAVRTVLLRRFGKLWTLLPSLIFGVSNRRKNSFIGKVLKYHKNPTIELLSIKAVPMDLCEPVNKCLKQWTTFAFKKKTKTLHIALDDDIPEFWVPRRVFSNQCLEILTLIRMDIKLPRRVFMGSLRKLDLVDARISDETFQELVSGCPCLKELVVLFPYSELEKIHFAASSIETLFIAVSYPNMRYSLDCPNLRILYANIVVPNNLKIIDVSSVREAHIHCSPPPDFYVGPSIADTFEPLLKMFPNARVFELNDKAYLQLQPCGSTKWVYGELLAFNLTVRLGVHGSCVLGFCRLLRNSLRLREVVIYADMDFFCDCNMLVPEISSPCVMQYLTTVTVHDCVKPCQALLQVLKFLLRSAIALDELVICCNNKDRLFSLEGRPFILELLSFPRASQKAKVAFT